MGRKDTRVATQIARWKFPPDHSKFRCKGRTLRLITESSGNGKARAFTGLHQPPALSQSTAAAVPITAYLCY